MYATGGVLEAYRDRTGNARLWCLAGDMVGTSYLSPLLAETRTAVLKIRTVWVRVPVGARRLEPWDVGLRWRAVALGHLVYAACTEQASETGANLTSCPQGFDMLFRMTVAAPPYTGKYEGYTGKYEGQRLSTPR